MKKQILTHFYDINPDGSLNNLSTGYALGTHWHNNLTGAEFVHEVDTIWRQIQTTELSLAYTIALS